MPGNALGCRIAHKALISSLVMGFVLAAGLDAACAQKVTTFPVPFVIGLTNGPDGALWFADISNQPHIGRITTAGAVTDFPLPANSTSGVAIVSGPDGALWFTEFGRDDWADHDGWPAYRICDPHGQQQPFRHNSGT